MYNPTLCSITGSGGITLGELCTIQHYVALQGVGVLNWGSCVQSNIM